MSSNMKTILIIGGTSGIGEACAKRFHSMGKKVIITGRRESRLNEIKNELSALETYAFDMTDFQELPSHIENVFTQHPDIDTVWVNSGIQYSWSILDPKSTTDTKVVDEVTTNVTAPILIARYVIPRLAARKGPSTFMITSSGLAFIPAGRMFPVYCATKAAMHSYLVGLRQSLKESSVNVIEIVPPLVEPTELGMEHKEKVKGGLKPLPLDEFLDQMFEGLEGKNGEEIKEVAAGTAVPRVKAWRDGMGPLMAQFGG